MHQQDLACSVYRNIINEVPLVVSFRVKKFHVTHQWTPSFLVLFLKHEICLLAALNKILFAEIKKNEIQNWARLTDKILKIYI